MARYYVHEAGQTLGPFEPADLVKRPGFNAAVPVCPVGSTSADAWRPASAVPEIAALLGGPPPPPPPPPPPAASPAPSTVRSELTLALPPGMEVAPKQEGPAGADPGTKLVLIVDDDETVRELIEARVAMAGFKTMTAFNGSHAKEKLSEATPDLIVTDMMMPGEGGYEFLRTMEGGAARRIPVFIVTGAPLNESTIDLMRAEANVVRFVRKPIEFDLFIEAIHKTLKTSPRASGPTWHP